MNQIDICTFLIISCSVLLRMENVAEKSCRENPNTILYSITFPRKTSFFSYNLDNMVELDRPRYGCCAFHAGYQRLHKHTQHMY